MPTSPSSAPMAPAFVYTTIIGGTTPATSTASATGSLVDSMNQAYIVGTGPTLTDLPGNVRYVNPVLGNYPGLNNYQGGDSDAFIVILAAGMEHCYGAPTWAVAARTWVRHRSRPCQSSQRDRGGRRVPMISLHITDSN